MNLSNLQKKELILSYKKNIYESRIFQFTIYIPKKNYLSTKTSITPKISIIFFIYQKKSVLFLLFIKKNNILFFPLQLFEYY